MTCFGILTRWLPERQHFQPFQIHEREVKTKNKKNHERKKRRKEEKPKVNLVLSRANHNF
jgi:hypothetical protein